jgi:hypothetical protein
MLMLEEVLPYALAIIGLSFAILALFLPNLVRGIKRSIAAWRKKQKGN